MIGYVTLGSNDPDRAKTFYDQVLAPLGGKRVFANDRLQFYSGPGGTLFAVGAPWDGEAATVGNGSMFGLPAPSRELVDEVHAAAMKAGAQDEGEPGSRTDSFYGAYFRDPDGNKLCVFKLG
jgi:catechol 2,3-dioxygenase-like lactoylglutathione lyase family enzyme